LRAPPWRFTDDDGAQAPSTLWRLHQLMKHDPVLGIIPGHDGAVVRALSRAP
jgi:hypothetical protein